MKNLLLLFIVGLLIFAVGCAKDENGPDPDPNSMDDLNIPDGFQYKTTQTMDIEIKMPPEVDFSKNKTRFNLYAATSPEPEKLILSGSFAGNGIFKGKITVPAMQEELYLQTIAGDRIIYLGGSFKNGVIIDFGDDYGYNPPDTVEPTLKSRVHHPKYQIKPKTTTSNVIGNGDFSQNDFGTVPHWNTNQSVDGKWYFTDYWMGEMEWIDVGGNGMIRTPESSGYYYYYGGASQWIDAEPGDVVSFSADIRSDGGSSLYSYLYLIPRRSNGSYIGFYYLRYYNPSSTWTNKTVVASMPGGTEYCQVLIWNTDYSDNHSIYYDNVVVTGPITDSDGDGVDDDQDDYPNDPDRAFDIYYPNSSTYGSFAFEDNWPGKGDYDFNDMVIDYQFKEVVNASNELVDLYADFGFMAAGATLVNGFGFEMDLEPSDIASVTGTSIVDGYITTGVNGTEANQSKGTIIVTDNIFTQLPHPGQGIGVNTSPSAPYVNPDTLQIVISLEDPVSLSESGRPPYNPFMIVDQIRGREVHLSDYTPTTLVNTSYFGTQDDDSNPATGKYYMTDNNLPWAINLPEHFNYPVEKAEIIDAYLHFAAWAESSGSAYEDWYGNEQGYRNSGNIYQVP